MNLSDLNLPYYGMYVTSYSMRIDIGGLQNVTLEIDIAPINRQQQLLDDIKILDAVRNSTNPTVKDQFEKLLTVMALTKNFDE